MYKGSNYHLEIVGVCLLGCMLSKSLPSIITNKATCGESHCYYENFHFYGMTDNHSTGSSNSDCAKVKAYKVPLKLLFIHKKGIIAFPTFGHLTISGVPAAIKTWRGHVYNTVQKP